MKKEYNISINLFSNGFAAEYFSYNIQQKFLKIIVYFLSYIFYYLIYNLLGYLIRWERLNNLHSKLIKGIHVWSLPAAVMRDQHECLFYFK